MADAAARNGRFLMEALWSRFLPAYVELRRLLGERVIGDVLLVEADFGFALPVDPAHRLYDLAMGGGCLLDLGIYPLQLATMVLGPAASVAAAGISPRPASTTTRSCRSRTSRAASRSRRPRSVSNSTNQARIAGSGGTIELPAMMHQPQHLDVIDVRTRSAGSRRRSTATACASRPPRSTAASGPARRESPVMPLAESPPAGGDHGPGAGPDRPALCRRRRDAVDRRVVDVSRRRAPRCAAAGSADRSRSPAT